MAEISGIRTRATHTAGGNTAGGGADRDRARGGAQTGTETPNTPPEKHRTQSEQPHQKPQAEANRSAEATEGKPATSTAPENAREERRSRHRTVPAASAEPTSERHQGAASSTPPRPLAVTKDREPTRQREAETDTGHLQNEKAQNHHRGQTATSGSAPAPKHTSPKGLEPEKKKNRQKEEKRPTCVSEIWAHEGQINISNLTTFNELLL